MKTIFLITQRQVFRGVLTATRKASKRGCHPILGQKAHEMQSLQSSLQWHYCPRGLAERASSQRKLDEAAMRQQTAHSDLMLQRAVQARLVSAQFAELRRNSFEEPSKEWDSSNEHQDDEAHDTHGEILAVGVGSSEPLVEWEPSTDAACVESAWDKDYDDERAKKRFRVDGRVRAPSRDGD